MLGPALRAVNDATCAEEGTDRAAISAAWHPGRSCCRTKTRSGATRPALTREFRSPTRIRGPTKSAARESTTGADIRTFGGDAGDETFTAQDDWARRCPDIALNGSPTAPDSYVAANKIDQRSFLGDWCNQAGAGIGARPQAQPFGSSDHVIAFVWIKPPGESDGDYPTSGHSHGDPHCDPAGTNTDGNGGTYPTGSLAGADVPAGQWYAAEFKQLVANAYPALS